MPTNVIMPQMGESIFEGTLSRWLKKSGDRVERDEPLFEISTDKVDAEIPSPAAGILSKVLVQEGQTVQINTVVAEIEAAGAQPAAQDRAVAQPAEQAGKAPVAAPAAVAPQPAPPLAASPWSNSPAARQARRAGRRWFENWRPSMASTSHRSQVPGWAAG